MSDKAKAGDKVRILKDTWYHDLTVGKEYVVDASTRDCEIQVRNTDGLTMYVPDSDFELVSTKAPKPQTYLNLLEDKSALAFNNLRSRSSAKACETYRTALTNEIAQKYEAIIVERVEDTVKQRMVKFELDTIREVERKGAEKLAKARKTLWSEIFIQQTTKILEIFKRQASEFGAVIDQLETAKRTVMLEATPYELDLPVPKITTSVLEVKGPTTDFGAQDETEGDEFEDDEYWCEDCREYHDDN